jgi:hypothetical protein
MQHIFKNRKYLLNLMKIGILLRKCLKNIGKREILLARKGNLNEKFNY